MGFVDVTGVVPNVQVLHFFILAFYVFDIAMAAIYVILLPFVDVEKHLPEINAELARRRREAVLARGEEWIEPEEQERREREALMQEAEEERIADLKEKCAKKGLDFETENTKALEKRARKAARKKR